METETEGEYWLVFRGFLQLQRDVAVGKMSAQRAKGFGTHSGPHSSSKILEKKSEEESEEDGKKKSGLSKILRYLKKGSSSSLSSASIEDESAKVRRSDY